MCKWNVGYYAIWLAFADLYQSSMSLMSMSSVAYGWQWPHIFCLCLENQSVWLIRVERALWALRKLDFITKTHSWTIFVSVVRVGWWCGPSRILRSIYSFSHPFSDPILFIMFSDHVWYLRYTGHSCLVPLPVLNRHFWLKSHNLAAFFNSVVRLICMNSCHAFR